MLSLPGFEQIQAIQGMCLVLGLSWLELILAVQGMCPAPLSACVLLSAPVLLSTVQSETPLLMFMLMMIAQSALIISVSSHKPQAHLSLLARTGPSCLAARLLMANLPYASAVPSVVYHSLF
jgi:ABC-type transport system involved in multi-copper enzyme maturation permease subunit